MVSKRETWIYSKAVYHTINVFEMWCYSGMLRNTHTTNVNVLQKLGFNETTMINNMKTRKMSYAGQIGTHQGIMRNTSGHYDTLLRTIEGILQLEQGKRGSKRPIRTHVSKI